MQKTFLILGAKPTNNETFLYYNKKHEKKIRKHKRLKKVRGGKDVSKYSKRF